jgi:hypothetical protein
MTEKSVTRTEITVLGLLLLLGLVQSLIYQYYYVDDTFITLRYLNNLIDGHGLSFNPGERTEGYSCFAWIVLLAPFARLVKAAGTGFPDTFILARILGIIAGLATLVVLWRMSRCLFGSPNRFWALVPPGWLVLSPPFWVWASSGMETALFAFLITLALHRFIIEDQDANAKPWSAFILILASLTRPEGPLYFIALLFYYLCSNRKFLSDRRFLQWLLLFSIPYAVYFIWRLAYFGQFFPTSVMAKSQTNPVWALQQGIIYLGNFFRMHGGTVLYLPVLIPLFVRESAGTTRVARASLAMAVAGAVLILIAGGDWMFYSRFVIPFLPALIVPTVMGYWLLYRAIRRRSGQQTFLSGRPALTGISAAVMILGSVYLSFSGFRGGGDDTMYDFRRTFSTWISRPHRLGPYLRTAWLTPVKGISFGLARDTTPLVTWVGTANTVADWIETNTDDTALLASTVAGYVPFRTGRPTIDMLGLNDVQIARLFRGGKYDQLVERVFSLKPEIVVLTILPETVRTTAATELTRSRRDSTAIHVSSRSTSCAFESPIIWFLPGTGTIRRRNGPGPGQLTVGRGEGRCVARGPADGPFPPLTPVPPCYSGSNRPTPPSPPGS